MALVYALPDGMENIARWKVALIVVQITDNVDLMATALGNVDVIAAGMAKTVVYYWNKYVTTAEITIKVNVSRNKITRI